MQGRTISEVSVAPDGYVTNVRILSSHAVFQTQVSDALQQWRFSRTGEAYNLEVTVNFDLDENSECTGKGTLTPENFCVC